MNAWVDMATQSSDTYIRVENISKKFSRTIRSSMVSGISEIARTILGQSRADSDPINGSEFWALRDVSFEIRAGEALGILGVNGSGKSTLLRLIAGIYPPTSGTIRVRGKIGALIALGAGFHPHLSGRENVYINGMLLGMSRLEVARVFDAIVDFAELGTFIDAPVSTYSSGMTVRLGFAIASHMNVDFLIADEVLAVGDLSFAIKCYRRLMQFKQNGGSILLVSHDLKQIRNVCREAIWLESGTIRDRGDVVKITNEYEKNALSKTFGSEANSPSITHADPSFSCTGVEILGVNGAPQFSFQRGEAISVKLNYHTTRAISDIIFSVTIINHEGITIVSDFSNFNGQIFAKIEGSGFLFAEVSSLNLNPGKYFLTFTVSEHDIGNQLIWLEKSHSFMVSTDGPPSYGLVRPTINWAQS